jgi:hypothetical protein
MVSQREPESLGRTLHRRKHQIAAWPTQAVNNLMKRIKRDAFGFTSFPELPAPITAPRPEAQLGSAQSYQTPLISEERPMRSIEYQFSTLTRMLLL